MFRGKETCKILKQIRQNIASENDIPLVVEECHYKGECRGTCPRCEAELEYLERELMKRRAMGKKLVLAGLSAGLSWTPMAAAENIQVSEVSTQQNTTQNDERTILIKGIVKDSYGEPIYGAAVMIQGTTKGVSTDFDGRYSINVERGENLEISAIGYEKVVKRVDELKSPILDVVLEEDDEPISEGIIVYCEPKLDEGTKRVRELDVAENGMSLTQRPLIQIDEYRSKDGKRNLQQDVLFNKVYPIVEKMNQDVKVKVQFRINEDRSLSDFKIVKSDDERFNEAAIETIKRMDGWRCQWLNGTPIKTRKTIIIHYRKEEIDRLIELENKP